VPGKAAVFGVLSRERKVVIADIGELLGSGDDLKRVVGIDREVGLAARVLNAGIVRDLDIGHGENPFRQWQPVSTSCGE
jgi:hypothetical protein